jgi:RND superfamily putative drug exporter
MNVLSLGASYGFLVLFWQEGHGSILITCGALILTFSFLSIATSPDIVVRMIATPLAFGIVLDAVVVRSFVVPALVALMGRWNWWMPDGLSRLLRLGPAAPATPADGR